jgi:hypothetical protein
MLKTRRKNQARKREIHRLAKQAKREQRAKAAPARSTQR